MAGDGAALQAHPHQPPRHAVSALALQGGAADEVGGHLQVHQPAQGGLQWRGGRIHVVAIEVHGRLQAQGVAGAEAAGGDPLRQELLPEGQARVALQQQLEAVLAGVAGAGREDRCPGGGAAASLQHQIAMAEAGQARQALAHQRFEPRGGLRSLQGQQDALGSLAIGDGDAGGLQLAADPGGVGLGAGGVDHQHHLVALALGARPPAAVVHDQVVADTAGVVEEHGVAGFAGADAEQIGGHQALEGVLDAIAPQHEHPHVGDVEDAAGLPHRRVLGHQAGELHRHLPTGEGHQPPAGGTGGAMEGGAPQIGAGGRIGLGGCGHGGRNT